MRDHPQWQPSGQKGSPVLIEDVGETASQSGLESLQQIIYGIEPALTDKVITPHSVIQDVDDVEAVAASQRRIMPICSGKELAVCGEIERGFSDEMAQSEASRCLQCGLICYEPSVEIEGKKESADLVEQG